MVRLAVVATVIASALVLASADDGAWVVKVPSGNGPITGSWASSATGDSFMFVIGGTDNANGTFQYSWVNNQWTSLGPVPLLSQTVVGADVAWTGGSLFMTGGAIFNNLISLDTLWVKSTTSTAFSAGWNLVPNPSPAPPARTGHSFTMLDGYGFLIGGWNTSTYYGGVWAFDITQLTQPINRWQNAAWINIVPDSNTASTAPPAMNGQSVLAYEGMLVLFGGFWHNAKVPWVSGDDCKRDPTLQCTFFNDVWVWDVPSPLSNTPWRRYPAKNGVVPPGRFGHAAGLVNGQTMIIFGGTGANGPLNDLWSFDLAGGVWRQLTPTGTAPPASMTPLGGTIGRHFVVYTGNSTNIYAYYPPDPSVPTPTPSTGECTAAHLGGITAGVVINILVSIAALVFSVLVWRMMKGGGGGGKNDSMYAAM